MATGARSLSAAASRGVPMRLARTRSWRSPMAHATRPRTSTKTPNAGPAGHAPADRARRGR